MEKECDFLKRCQIHRPETILYINIKMGRRELKLKLIPKIGIYFAYNGRILHSNSHVL